MSLEDGFPVLMELDDSAGTPAFRLDLGQKIKILTPEGEWGELAPNRLDDYYKGTVLNLDDWYLAMNRFLQNKMVDGKRLAYLAFKKVDKDLETATMKMD